MESKNYFQHASRPTRPDTPQLRILNYLENSYDNDDSDDHFSDMTEQFTGYHGLGISGIHTLTPRITEQFHLPSPVSSEYDTDQTNDQYKTSMLLDEDMVAHDLSRGRCDASEKERETDQVPKQFTSTASDVNIADSRNRRSSSGPPWNSRRTWTREASADRRPQETSNSHEFWKICLLIRKVTTQGNRGEDSQKLLTTPHCCKNCGTPVSPVVFTPSRSSEVVNA